MVESTTMPNPHLLTNVPDFSQARVLIVGDVMLDRYWFGDVSRISPEAPVPVVHVHQQEHRLGGAANVAANTAALGVSTSLLGLVGDDEAAAKLESLLEARRIQSHLHPVVGGKTITKLRIVSRQQQLIRLDFEDAFTDDQSHALLNAFNARLNDADAVILSDYAKGALRQVSDMIQLARQAGKPVIVDTKGHDFQRYRGATVITPNMGEFEAVVGRCHDEDDIETVLMLL